MSTFKHFQEMEVWKNSMVLISKIYYKATWQSGFNKDFELSRQIRKSSISIASNIAEGFERDGNKEFINFLYISKGSCGELICQLEIAKELGYLETENYQELSNLAEEISRTLGKLIKYLKGSDLKGKKYQ